MYANVTRYGIILNTERYSDCVAFYRDLFELPVLFEASEGDGQLACFEYGHGYLMVEEGGKAGRWPKKPEEGSFKLRFNSDPDGNRIGIRDESGFPDGRVPRRKPG